VSIESRDPRTAHTDHRLERVAIDLATASSRDEIAIVLLRDGVPALGATTGSLALLDPTATVIESVATAGYAPEARDTWSRVPLEADLPASEVVRTGRPVFLGSASERDARYPAFATAPVAGSEAAAVLPLVRDGTPFGCVTIGYAEPKEFAADDQRLLEAVVAQCAIALERIDADETASETFAQLQFLVDASAVLGSSLDYESTLARVAELAVPRIADWCTVHLTVDGTLQLVAAAHTDADRLAYLRDLHTRYPIDPDAPTGAGAAVREGRTAVQTEIDDEVLRGVARDEEHLAVLRSGFASGLVAVPLNTDGDPFGVIVLGNDRGRSVTRAQRALAEALGGRAAVAIERARWYESERLAREEAERARGRLAFLAEASAALAASLDFDETLHRVVDIVVPRFADLCTVHVRDGRAVRRVAFGHADPTLGAALADAVADLGPEVHHPVVDNVLASGQPALDLDGTVGVPDAPAVIRAVVSRFSHRSAMFLPLVVGGDVLGVIGFVQSVSGRRFDADDVDLARDLAGRVAMAVDNARIHRARTEVADTLQRSLLPPALPVIDAVDLAAVYLPAGIGIDAGGDFFDVFPAGAGRWSIVIGDVCGTGAAAAAITAQVRHTLRAEARHGNGDVASVVAAVNDVLAADIDVERFCTVLYGELAAHPDGGLDVALVAAGHPPPFLLRRGMVSEVSVRGMLLGVTSPAVGTPAAVHLEPGDALVLVTDGVLEARSADDRRVMFGGEGVCRALRHAADDADSVARAVENEVMIFTAGALDDDVAILVVRAR